VPRVPFLGETDMRFFHEIRLRKVDSTSAFLRRYASIIGDKTFVSAFFQTQGHGRLGRTWESHKGENLLFSVICKHPNVVENFRFLSCASALAVCRALCDIGVSGAKIKWPNDVYVGDRKISGILLEGLNRRGKMNAVIIGIGVNVNQTEFSSSCTEPTSIKLESGTDSDIKQVRKAVYTRLCELIRSIEAGDFSFVSEVQSLDYLSEMNVTCELDGVLQPVQVVGINPDCSLRVISQGVERDVVSGEITFHKKA